MDETTQEPITGAFVLCGDLKEALATPELRAEEVGFHTETEPEGAYAETNGHTGFCITESDGTATVKYRPYISWTVDLFGRGSPGRVPEWYGIAVVHVWAAGYEHATIDPGKGVWTSRGVPGRTPLRASVELGDIFLRRQ